MAQAFSIHVIFCDISHSVCHSDISGYSQENFIVENHIKNNSYIKPNILFGGKLYNKTT